MFSSPPLVSVCVITSQISQKVEVGRPLLTFLFALMVTELPLSYAIQNCLYLNIQTSIQEAKPSVLVLCFLCSLFLYALNSSLVAVFLEWWQAHMISLLDAADILFLIIIVIIKKVFWNTYIIMYSIVSFKICISKMLCWFCADCVE